MLCYKKTLLVCQVQPQYTLVRLPRATNLFQIVLLAAIKGVGEILDPNRLSVQVSHWSSVVHVTESLVCYALAELEIVAQIDGGEVGVLPDVLTLCAYNFHNLIASTLNASRVVKGYFFMSSSMAACMEVFWDLALSAM